jgi:hypothetical protein
MQKYFLTLILLLIISSCSVSEKEVFPEVPFELKVGQTAEIEGHEFTLQEVSSDSRCPVDAKCIWASEATVHLVSYDDEGNAGDVYISTNSTDAYVPLFPQTKYEQLGISPEYKLAYLISLNSISPEPETGKEIQLSDYKAHFTIWLAM